ncbi:MAG: hypoxanthine phosphoribosyltransferase [Bifidobacteriaceae bacterium]|jgi:hypoxanthine phosphoribosyltransferase|nr:hypoxanthine phosphoribosyltransferase [Bifidobacteriaceae bacterium]
MGLSEYYKDDIERVLISQTDLNNRIGEIAMQLDKDYKGKNLLVIGILKGAIFTITNLLEKMQKNVDLDFMTLSSYGDKVRSSGSIKLVMDLDRNVENTNILIVEDIIDTGLTMKWLLDYLYKKKAASVEIFTLLEKKEGHKHFVNPKYVGFQIPNEFVVGFGLDYGQYYRNVPYIGVLKEGVYKGE